MAEVEVMGDDRVIIQLGVLVVVDEKERHAVIADGDGFHVSDEPVFEDG